MEQAVWMVFAVMAIGISVATIMVIFDATQADTQSRNYQKAVRLLEAQCNFVCGGLVGQRSSIDVTIPTPFVLNTTQQVICVTTPENRYCGRCGCEVSMQTPIVANTSVAIAAVSLDYSCAFLRERDQVRLTCQG
ncbi:MAG: hypothetical protein ACMXYF_05260 [Candidatus Woesearchaeota archaeon]